ncbi:MAG: 2-phospho-L-lactate transferase CofD family protein, partial [Candidatus Omnitrophota bacterium]
MEVLPKFCRKSLFCKSVSILVILSFVFSNITFAESIQKKNHAPKKTQSPADINNIVIEKDHGIIKSKFSGNSNKLIINIQDAHCNYEAQTNIVNILEGLINNHGLSLISVEGADGIIDTAWFKAFPDEDVRKEVATYFMKKGEITGPEFLSITKNYPIKLFGAEDRESYIQNLNAFTSSYPLKAETEKYYNSIRNSLSRLKGLIYSADLKAMDAKSQDYESKKLQFNDYIRFLQDMAEKQKINVRNYENLFRITSVLTYEKKINFSITDRERAILIDELSKAVSKDELTDMVSKSIAFKTGAISSVEFYNHLKKLALQNDIDLAKKYPNLYNYIIYNSVYAKIDNEKLFDEIKTVESDIKEKLFTSDDQRTLDKLSRHIDILIGMANIKLLNGDFNYFETHREGFTHEAFTDFIKKQGEKYGLSYEVEPPTEAVAKSIPKLEEFYVIAMKRDKALVDNTIKAMEKDKLQVAVLVTGGFHSEGMSKLLEKRGVSYVVVCPSITKDVPTPYIQVLTNQRTPIEDILASPEASKKGMLAPISAVELATMSPKELKAFLQCSPMDAEIVSLVEGITDRTVNFRKTWFSYAVSGWLRRVLAAYPNQVLTRDENFIKQAYISGMKLSLTNYLKEQGKSADGKTVKVIIDAITSTNEFNEEFQRAFASQLPEVTKMPSGAAILPVDSTGPPTGGLIGRPDGCAATGFKGTLSANGKKLTLTAKTSQGEGYSFDLSVLGKAHDSVIDRQIKAMEGAVKSAGLSRKDKKIAGQIIQFIKDKQREGNIVVLKENDKNVFGFSDGQIIAISELCINNNEVGHIALFHEGGEGFLSSNPAVPGVNVGNHTYLRGKGKGIRLGVREEMTLDEGNLQDGLGLQDKVFGRADNDKLTEFILRARLIAEQRKSLLEVFGGKEKLMMEYIDKALKTHKEMGLESPDDVIAGMFAPTTDADKIRSFEKTIENIMAGRDRTKDRKTILAFGGGTGLLASIKPLVKMGAYVRSMQCSTDDGGSTFKSVTGLINKGYGWMPSPGDMVNSIFEGFAEADKLYKLLDAQGRIDVVPSEEEKIAEAIAKKELPADAGEHVGQIVYRDDAGNVTYLNSFFELSVKLLNRIVLQTVINKQGIGGIQKTNVLSEDFAYFAASVLNLARRIDANYFEKSVIPVSGASIRNLMLISALDYLGIAKPTHAPGSRDFMLATEADYSKFQVALDSMAELAGVRNGRVSLSHNNPETMYAVYRDNVVIIEVKPKVSENGVVKSVEELRALVVHVDKARGETTVKILDKDDTNLYKEYTIKAGEEKKVFVGMLPVVLRMSEVDRNFAIKVGDSEFAELIEPEGLVEETAVKLANEDKQRLIATDGTGMVYKPGVARSDKAETKALVMGGKNVYIRSRFTKMQTHFSETANFSKIEDLGLVDQDGKRTNRSTPANKDMIAAVENAETKGIIFGPGSFLTSIMPHFMVEGLAEALEKRRAKGDIPIVLIINPNRDNETTEFSIPDMLRMIEDAVAKRVGRRIPFDSMFTDLIINKDDTVKLEEYFGMPENSRPANAEWYVDAVMNNPVLIDELGLSHFQYLIKKFSDATGGSSNILSGARDRRFYIENDNGKPIEFNGQKYITLKEYLEVKMREYIGTLYGKPKIEIRTDAGQASKEAKKSRGPMLYAADEINTIKTEYRHLRVYRDIFLAGIEFALPRSAAEQPVPHVGFLRNHISFLMGEIFGLRSLNREIAQAYDMVYSDIINDVPDANGKYRYWNSEKEKKDYLEKPRRDSLGRVIEDKGFFHMIYLKYKHLLAKQLTVEAHAYLDQLGVDGFKRVVDTVHIADNIHKNGKRGLGITVLADVDLDKGNQDLSRGITEIRKKIEEITNGRVQFNRDQGSDGLFITIRPVVRTRNFDTDIPTSKSAAFTELTNAVSDIKERMTDNSMGDLSEYIAQTASSSRPFSLKITGFEYSSLDGELYFTVEPVSEFNVDKDGHKTLKVMDALATLPTEKREAPMHITLGRVTRPIDQRQIDELNTLFKKEGMDELPDFSIDSLRVVVYSHRTVSNNEVLKAETLELGRPGQKLNVLDSLPEVEAMLMADNNAKPVSGQPQIGTLPNITIPQPGNSYSKRLVDNNPSTTQYGLTSVAYLKQDTGKFKDFLETAKEVQQAITEVIGQENGSFYDSYHMHTTVGTMVRSQASPVTSLTYDSTERKAPATLDLTKAVDMVSNGKPFGLSFNSIKINNSGEILFIGEGDSSLELQKLREGLFDAANFDIRSFDRHNGVHTAIGYIKNLDKLTPEQRELLAQKLNAIVAARNGKLGEISVREISLVYYQHRSLRRTETRPIALTLGQNNEGAKDDIETRLLGSSQADQLNMISDSMRLRMARKIGEDITLTGGRVAYVSNRPIWIVPYKNAAGIERTAVFSIVSETLIADMNTTGIELILERGGLTLYRAPYKPGDFPVGSGVDIGSALMKEYDIRHSAQAYRAIAKEVEQAAGVLGLKEISIGEAMAGSMNKKKFLNDIAESVGISASAALEQLAAAGLVTITNKDKKEYEFSRDFFNAEKLEKVKDLLVNTSSNPAMVDLSIVRISRIAINSIDEGKFIALLAQAAGMQEADVLMRLGRENAFSVITAAVELSYASRHSPVPGLATLQLSAADFVSPLAAQYYETQGVGVEFSIPKSVKTNEVLMEALTEYQKRVINDMAQGGYNYRGAGTRQTIEQFFNDYFKKEWYPKIRAFVQERFNKKEPLKYIITNGIGANDQFMWSLVNMYNANRPEGAPVWYHVTTARDFASLLSQGVKGENSLFIDISRSGGTWEGVEVGIRSLAIGFNKRIGLANGGAVSEIAKQAARIGGYDPLIIGMSPDIGGRNMHRKTTIYYTAQTVAGMFLPSMDAGVFADFNDRFDKANDFSSPDTNLAVSAGKFLHGSMRVMGVEHIAFATNTEPLRLVATEWEQYIMEGSNKEDIISMGIHDLASEPSSVLSKLANSPAGKISIGMVILDKAAPSYSKDVELINKIKEKMPVMIFTIDSTAIKGGIDQKQQAAFDILWTDLVTVFTSLLKVDANSNPNVKVVREETAKRVGNWKAAQEAYSNDAIGKKQAELLVSYGNPAKPGISTEGAQVALNKDNAREE